MEPWPRLILRDQTSGEMVSDLLSQRQQVGAVDAYGNAAPQREKALSRSGRCCPVGKPPQHPAKFRNAGGRQVMEQGQMRRKAVELRRKMASAQCIRPCLVLGLEISGNDYRPLFTVFSFP